MRDFWFSRRWRFESTSTGLWCCVVEAESSSETLPSCHNTTRPHNPQDFETNQQSREKLKSRMKSNIWGDRIVYCVSKLGQTGGEAAGGAFHLLINLHLLSLQERFFESICLHSLNPTKYKSHFAADVWKFNFSPEITWILTWNA
jgi:hypothetical protein